MPSATAALATSTPMAPKPMTPSVLPRSSGPTNAFLPFSTAFSMPSPCPFRPRAHSTPPTMSRQESSMAASTISQTALAFAPGVLNTHDARLRACVDGDVVRARARARNAQHGGRKRHVVHGGRTDENRIRLLGAVADVIVFAELGVNRGGNRVQRLNLIVHDLILHLKLLHEIDELLARPRSGMAL